MTKRGKIILISSISVGAILCGSLSYYYFGNTHTEFFSTSEKDIKIPGLDEGFIPQGLCIVDNDESYLISGYMNNNSLDSRIYHVNKDGDEKWINISTGIEDVEYFHFGGISCVNDKVFISSDGYVFTLDYNILKDEENGSKIDILSKFEVDSNTAFCYANESKLIVGEFYRPKVYETDKTHYVEKNNGEFNHSIAYIYDIDTSNANGVVSNIPTGVISLPDQAQGLSIDDKNQVIISTSYGLPDSLFYVYDGDFLNEPAENNIDLNDTSLPLWILQEEVLEYTFKTPSMSEGIDFYNGKLYILFESACNKYKYFTRNRLSNIYKYSLD